MVPRRKQLGPKRSSAAPARQIVDIENTPMFIQIAEGLEIRSILHTDYRSTCAKLASFRLEAAG